MKKLRYLWVHSNHDEWMTSWHERNVERHRRRGYDVESYLLQPNPGVPETYYFPKLDKMWRRADPKLMYAYENLAAKLVGRDVLIHYSGTNLHPAFLEQLGVYKVFMCGDDPEATRILSRPVAPYYELHLVHNIAEVETYRNWGLEDVHFLPLGSLVTEDDTQDLTEDVIGNRALRDVPIVFCGDFGGIQLVRAKRMAALATAFPEAHCYGRGWPRGFISWSDMWKLYRGSQIGWNVHNSTGPINLRTYELPAHGVFQICDNRSYLGSIYELGTEVAGFDTIEECIDLTRYYLEHPEEQRTIAIAAWKRWKEDYTPDRVWDRTAQLIERSYRTMQPHQRESIVVYLNLQSEQAQFSRAIAPLEDALLRVRDKLIRVVRRLVANAVRKQLLSPKQ